MLSNKQSKELVSKNFVNYVCASWDGLSTYLPLHTGWWFETVEKAGKTVAEAIKKFKETSTKEDYDALKVIADAAVISAACTKSKFDKQLSALVSLWKANYLVFTHEDKKEEDQKDLQQRLEEAAATIKKIGEDNDNKVSFLQAEIQTLQAKNERLASEAKMFEVHNQELLRSLNKQGSSQAELVTGMSERVMSVTVAHAEAKADASQKAAELNRVAEELRQVKDELAKLKESKKQELEAKDARIKELQEIAKEISRHLTQAQMPKASFGSNGLYKQLPGLARHDRDRSASMSDIKDCDQFSVLSGGSAQSVLPFFSATPGDKDAGYIKNLRYGVNPKYHEVYEILYRRISESKEDVKYEKAIMTELLYRNACALIASDSSALSIETVLAELEKKCPVLKAVISLVRTEMKQTDEIIPAPENKRFDPLGHIKSLTSKGYCKLGKVVGAPVHQNIEMKEKGGNRSPGEVAAQTLEVLIKAEKAEESRKAMPPPALPLPSRSRPGSVVGKLNQ